MTINTKYLALLAALLLPASAFAQEIPTVNAAFDVYKHWNQDGVPITESVPVHIVCTSGDPTTADTVISVAQNGTFLIEDIPLGGQAAPEGIHNCTITEDVPDGYTAEYNNNGGTVNDESCLFEDIDIDSAQGTYRCDITNTPDEGSLTVTKTWILAGADAGFDGEYKIKAICDTEVNAPDNCAYIPNDDPEGDPICATDLPENDEDYLPALFETGSGCKSGGNKCWAWVKTSASLGDYDFKFGIPEPAFGGTGCTVEESFDDSVVESQNGCSDPETIEAGQDESCEIVNTVFFEGIPTLNQYGMAILALLMLGVGFVGFRRFV